MESWYSESKDYDFKHPGFQSNTGTPDWVLEERMSVPVCSPFTQNNVPLPLSPGHFTQVVWVGSQRMGIGKATDGEGMVIAVARYHPAGNISNAGYFEKNVLPKGTPPAGGASRDPEPKKKENETASAGNSSVPGKKALNGLDDSVTPHLGVNELTQNCVLAQRSEQV